VLLNKECTITDYYLSDNNTYSNGEDVRKDYMLKAPSEESSSIFKSIYNTFQVSIFYKIRKIFLKKLNDKGGKLWI
jgi:hypothetical protein